MARNIKIEQPPRITRLANGAILKEVTKERFKRYRMSYREATALRCTANIWKNRGEGEFSIVAAEECGPDVYDVILVTPC